MQFKTKLRSIVNLISRLAPLVVLMFSFNTASSQETVMTGSRGYQTTPAELKVIRQKADAGLDPYQEAVERVIREANREWDYEIREESRCGGADSPSWLDNDRGISKLYAKALAYHLTDDSGYAEEVRVILEKIMTGVRSIRLNDQQCRLNFAWGIPEIVASADLIEDYWYDMTCRGPVSTTFDENELATGNCKHLFQNWLAKNPYYVVSLSAEQTQSNWGAAGTNTLAYIADYLWDRPDIVLIHRLTDEEHGNEFIELTPADAYQHANQLALDRMNGYRVERQSYESCDYLSGDQQDEDLTPVKSQITPSGVIPEDARREEFCNIPHYDGSYQNYPQIHIGNNIQQCELMLRRGDSSCYDNIDMSDLPNYEFVDPEGETRTTYLYPGRGSLERAINAIIIDSGTEWRHDSALEVAYRYYFNHATSQNVLLWFEEIDRPAPCEQDMCFGTLTHGFSPGEVVGLPPTVPPPTNP